ncbi:hypothetical protein MATL_G00231790 [Megalops atlanticus]|uniref:Uncharacterized protein n=1 Tax=Megalops atlanticus TaxID=7932 RepID=A0A9D3T2E1_MEGAT|nr:hypothetical protein MATL_G00231790 [Megalops atlanticus]
MPRMLQDHHGVQPRTDGGAVCGLLHSALPAHWWEGAANRRMLVQEKAALAALMETEEGGGVGPEDFSDAPPRPAPAAAHPESRARITATPAPSRPGRPDRGRRPRNKPD